MEQNANNSKKIVKRRKRVSLAEDFKSEVETTKAEEPKAEDTSYLTAKKLRYEIFKVPLLPQEECVEIFNRMDEILKECIFELIDLEVLAVEDYLKDIVFKVASGNTQSKNYYHKKDHEDSSKKKTKVISDSEFRFLKKSFNLLNPNITKAQKKEIIANSDFLRGVLESAVLFYLSYADLILNKNLQIHINTLKCYDLDGILETYKSIKSKFSEYEKLKEKLIKPYLRLVYSEAAFKANTYGQTLDNFQNGYFGLLRSISQYTQTRFAVFSVHAKSWINQSILHSIKQDVNFIKLPVGIWNNFHKLEKVKAQLESQLSRSATEEELARSTNIDIDRMKQTYQYVNFNKVLSLDVPTSNEEEQGHSASWNRDSVEYQHDMEKEIEEKSDFKQIEKIVDEMPDEMKMIFGLTTGCLTLIPEPSFTVEELTKEVLRQKFAQHNLDLEVIY